MLDGGKVAVAETAADFAGVAEVDGLGGMAAAGLGLLAAGAAAGGGGSGSSGVTFEAVPDGSGTISFEGTADGAVSVALSDEALTFQREGVEDMEVGYELVGFDSAEETTLQSLRILAEDSSDLIFSGSYDGLQALVFDVQDVTDGVADSKTLTLDTSGLIGVDHIVFDFEDESDYVIVTAGSDISGFATIEVSKGTTDLRGVNVLPDVEFIVNSGVVLTADQFVATASLVSSSGLGRLTISIETAEDLQALQDAVDGKILIGFGDGEASGLTNITIVAGEGNSLYAEDGAVTDDLLDADGNVLATAADVQSFVEAFEAASTPSLALLGQSILDLAADLGVSEANIVDLNDQIAALVSDAAANDGSATTASIEGLRIALTEMQQALTDFTAESSADYDTLSEIGAAFAEIQATLASLGESYATDAELTDALAAFGATQEAALETAISNLEAKLQGAGFDAETDVATFEAISDAIAALEAAGNTSLSDQFATLTSNYEAAIETAISALEQKLQGAGVDAADFTTLADLAAAIEALDTAGAAALSEQFATLTTNYEAAIATAISGLETKLQGAGFDAETDLATFEAISDAIAALESAGSGDVSALQSQIDSLSARLDSLEATPLDWSDATVGFAAANPEDGNAENTFTASEIFGDRGSASVRVEFADTFAARIEGYDPATVPLTVTDPLTVAQATALSEAGFVLSGVDVTYEIRDAYTTIQAALADPDQNAALTNATEVVATGDELDNSVAMTAMDRGVSLRTELSDGADSYDAGQGDETVVGGLGGDNINLTFQNDQSEDHVV